MRNATQDLVDLLASAVKDASSLGRRALASATIAVEPTDVSGAVLASRLASDRWFCWEQPDRDGFALGALGSAHEVVSRGPGRFGDVARDCSELLRDAAIEAPHGLPAGAGPVWTGGFAFAPDGGRSPHWSSLPPALMVLPELSLLRDGDGCWLTLNLVVEVAGEATAALERARSRLAGLREADLGPLDPAPTGTTRIDAPRPPGHYEHAVAAGVGQIAAGELEKLVLAREVTVTAPAAHEPGPILGALRDLFPSCFCFCAGTPEAGVHRRQPRAPDPPPGRGCRHGRAGRLDAAQRRPRGGRPPRRADAAQPQGAPGAWDRRQANRALPAPARSLGPR